MLLRSWAASRPALGADAVVGIDIDYETVRKMPALLMVSVSGTAVKTTSMKRSLSTLLAMLLAGCASEEGIVDKGMLTGCTPSGAGGLPAYKGAGYSLYGTFQAALACDP